MPNEVVMVGMTCRHQLGDPRCTSGNSPEDLRIQAIEDYKRWVGDEPPTPDAKRFQWVGAAQVGPHLVATIKYPTCSRCEYEGRKIMVFLNVSLQEAILWTTIDPHFRDPTVRAPTEAPSPAARFPASDEGLRDAVQYAELHNRG